MKMIIAGSFLTLLVSSSCLPPPHPQTIPTPASTRPIIEADEQMIVGCQFLGSVLGRSTVGGLASGIGHSRAIKSAKDQARKKGGTHIIIDPGSYSNAGSGGPLSTVSGRVYKCGE